MHHAASSANLVAQRNDASSGVGAFAPMMFFYVVYKERVEERKKRVSNEKKVHIYIRKIGELYIYKTKTKSCIEEAQQQHNIPGVTYFFNNFSASGLIP